VTPARSRERVRSPQTLSQADRRLVSVWAADCADRVLGLFEAAAPGDARPRQAITGIRAFARGELGVWPARSLAGHSHAAAREITDNPAAVAAARAAGQAAATAHMGAHALGAAAYAAKAAGLAGPDRPEAVTEEIRWQIEQLSPAARVALLQLPPVGTSKAGPIGPGLLASGQLGAIVAEVQLRLDPKAVPSTLVATALDARAVDLDCVSHRFEQFKSDPGEPATPSMRR